MQPHHAGGGENREEDAGRLVVQAGEVDALAAAGHDDHDFFEAVQLPVGDGNAVPDARRAEAFPVHEHLNHAAGVDTGNLGRERGNEFGQDLGFGPGRQVGDAQILVQKFSELHSLIPRGR